MRLTQRRVLLNKARDKAEQDAAKTIARLLDRRFKTVKRQLRAAGFNRRQLGRRLQTPGAGILHKQADEDDEDWSSWIDDFTQSLQDVMVSIAGVVGEVEIAYWNSREKTPGRIDAEALVSAYMARNGKQIKAIATDTRDNVLRDITEWHATAEGLPDLIDRLEQYFNSDRAETIARTEAAYLSSMISDDIYQRVGVEYFNWDVADEVDGWPCEICQEKAANNPYEVGEELPPAHPRCRCGSVPANADGSVFI